MSGVEQASPIALRKSAVSSAPCESFVSDCGSERDTLRSAGNNSAVRDRSLPTFSVASQAIVFCQSPTIRHAREKSRRGRVAGEGRQFAGGSLRGSDDPFMDWLVSLSPKSSCSSINGSPRIVCVPESAVAGSPLHPSSEQSSVFMDAPLLESGSFCSQSSDGMSAMKQRHHLSAPPPLGDTRRQLREYPMLTLSPILRGEAKAL
uniref:WGS project CAEQ00000000 data, annotated contig 1507 n=1 Tax=Trypanosoma congolense (strain IL3000) TaxID=1068625 RepID=F9W6Q7_TRYCI|nr:unnamed protein product [Trypanosoma congolense IL3000]